MVAQRFLDILWISLDLVNQRGINLANDHRTVIAVDEEVNKLLTIEAQLGTETIDAFLHTVLRMIPKCINNLLNTFITGRDGDAFT